MRFGGEKEEELLGGNMEAEDMEYPVSMETSGQTKRRVRSLFFTLQPIDACDSSSLLQCSSRVQMVFFSSREVGEVGVVGSMIFIPR